MTKVVWAFSVAAICVWCRAQETNWVGSPGAERTANIDAYPDSTRLSARCPDRNYPPGWGVYNGGCAITWGTTSAESRSGDRSAFLRIVAPVRYGDKFFYSGALLVGEGDGYSGENALEVKPDTRYKFSVWAKMSIPCSANVFLSGYATRKGKNVRQSLPLAALMVDGKMVVPRNNQYAVSLDGRWRRLEGVFVTGADTETVHIGLGISRVFDKISEFDGVTLFADDAEVLAR